LGFFSNEDISEGLVYKEIRKYLCIIYIKGPFDNAGSVYSNFYSSWLKQSGYKLSHLYNIEINDEQNPDLRHRNLTDIYFPVRKQK
jgi:AraC family transcriptional regulator